MRQTRSLKMSKNYKQRECIKECIKREQILSSKRTLKLIIYYIYYYFYYIDNMQFCEECTKQTRDRIEYWKTERGAITKLKLTNDQTEEFLKDYRTNFTGNKSDSDDKLLDVLNSGEELSEMSKYILDRIKEDFEDAEEDVEYFQELREKIVKFL